MFHTGSGKQIGFAGIPDTILAYYNRHKDLTNIKIIIGTDSQNFSDTKMVSVICVIAAGRGGIFFYNISRIDRIVDVRRKLHIETNASLELASGLVEIFEGNEKYHAMYLDCPISIHVDAGNSPHGKTRELIPELVRWIRASGYEAETKPLSFVASCVADKISK